MNTRTRSISIIVAALLLVSLLVVAFPAFKSSAADTNYALKSAGASYTIKTLAADGSEGDAAFLGSMTADSSYTFLNDGATNVGESNGSSTALVGTSKTHRFKFDLGASKTGINKIVIQNAINSANEMYNGSPAGNRGYDLDTIKVQAGASTTAMSTVSSSATKSSNGSGYSDEITVTFSAVSARYVWIDITSKGYVLSLDEIQIWGSSSTTQSSETNPSTPSQTDPTPSANANYALKTAGGSYTIKTLAADGSEGDAAFLGSMTADSSYTFLNDGATNVGENNGSSTALVGTSKTHRFKFDLGALKTNVSKVVIKNLIDSANVMYNGSPAGNRGFDLDSIVVKAGASASSLSTLTTTKSKTENGSGYSYEATIQFAATDARYVYIDITSKGYVLSLDEIEIWGGSGDAPIIADAKFDLSLTAPETVEAGAQFDVEIEVKNIKATNGLVGVDFVLTFDSAKVTPVYTTDEAMIANFFKKNPSNRWEDAGSYYNASAASYNIRFCDKDATTAYGIKADNTLVFKVAFTAKSTLAAGATMSFTAKDVIGTDPGDASYNGFGDVAGNGGTVALAIAEPTQTESETQATTTETDPPVTGTIGDINGDGDVDSLDANYAARYDAGIITLTAEQIANGDVNGDGDVDSLDANLIAKYDAGLISSFPRA